MFGLEILLTFKQRVLCIDWKPNEMSEKIQVTSARIQVKVRWIQIHTMRYLAEAYTKRSWLHN